MNIYRNTKNISNVENIKRKVIQDITHELILNHRNAFQTASTGQINTKVDLRVFAAIESKLKEKNKNYIKSCIRLKSNKPFPRDLVF